ncbi:MAG: TRC40/GET3/ArsA family transport-energizing ATPase [bacterium]
MKYMFFSGKGGVGKTTISSAAALNLALNGKKTLIVSTDPASNLSDIFEQNLKEEETKIKGVDNLYASEINAADSLEKYRAKVLGDSIKGLDNDVVSMIEEEFKSPCTEEIASFDSFTGFIARKDFDVIIFDTAPTGHTLRLMSLPLKWTTYIEEVKKGEGRTCMGPVTNLEGSIEIYNEALKILTDKTATNFLFVMRPQELSFYETLRSIEEIKSIGITNIEILINQVLPDKLAKFNIFEEQYKLNEKIIEQAKKTGYKIKKYYLMPEEIKGLDSLKKFILMEDKNYAIKYFDKFFNSDDNNNAGGAHHIVNNGNSAISDLNSLNKNNSDLINRINSDAINSTKFIFFIGKGGTGKSTVSLLTGLYLSKYKNKKTLVVSVDPASHIGKIMGVESVNEEPVQVENKNLFLSIISPDSALSDYKADTLQFFKKVSNNADSLKVLEEELNSPCTFEIAYFKKFYNYFKLGYGKNNIDENTDTCININAGANLNPNIIKINNNIQNNVYDGLKDEFDYIIFDTAPTGHALRLLFLAFEYQKENKNNNSAKDEELEFLINTIKDKEKTYFSLVLYPEFTPIEEAYRAYNDLKGAGIDVSFLSINYLLNEKLKSIKFFKDKINQESKYLDVIKEKFNLPSLYFEQYPYEINYSNMEKFLKNSFKL